MADRLIKAAKKARVGMWQSFKDGIKIPGYAYYEPPAEITYRYPAPGSQPLSEEDQFHMYKSDWKLPFRDSDYCIAEKEL